MIEECEGVVKEVWSFVKIGDHKGNFVMVKKWGDDEGSVLEIKEV